MMRLLAKPALFAASLLLMGSLALPASAQFFTSGSTGANGPFPPNGAIPSGTNNLLLDLETGVVTYRSNSTPLGTASVGSPTAGVFNFTTFTVPSNFPVYLSADSRNRPAQFLTTGDVAINSSLYLNGAPGAAPSSIIGGVGGAGGPGGYNGGTGGTAGESPTLGTPGAGPSGGGVGQSGTLTTSNQQLQPLFGGSGGGGSNPTSAGGYGGGGGGGALLLASSGTISINSLINAQGGSANGGAGVGSGGAVHLIANTISGNGQIYLFDGSGSATKGGYARTEANTNTFTGFVAPSGISLTSVPSPPLPTGLGTITIQSIGGVAVPANSGGGTPSKVDITFQTPQTAPVTVVVATTNIPLNTTFTLILATTTAAQGGTGQVITATGTISSGTVAAGSGSTTISLPVGTSVIDVIAAFQLPTTQAMQLEKAIGEKVARAEVRSRLGGEAGMDYITVSGHRINASSLNSLR